MGLKGIEPLNVEPGDTVIYQPGYPQTSPGDWTITRVEKVTPKAGEIVTADGKRFDKDGFELRAHPNMYPKPGMLKKLTDELEGRIMHARHIQYLQDFEWDTLDAVTAAAVVALLPTLPQARGTQ